MIYTHLTRMSFDFYDRVQTGQLISRANSDIRSVQMYLTFGPNIIVQCSIALVAFIYMLTINVPLAFVAMATLPLVFVMAVRMRQQHVPGLVADSGASRGDRDDRRREHQRRARVVKSFVAEQRELNDARRRQPTSCSGAYIRDADLRAKFTPLVQNLPQVGLALVLLLGGYLVIHGQPPASARSSPSAPTS